MTEEAFLYYCLEEDKEKGRTSLIEGYMEGEKQKSVLFERIYIKENAQKQIDKMLARNIHGKVLWEEMEQLNQLLGGKSYYSSWGFELLYARYLGNISEEVSINNLNDLCKNMIDYLHESIEQGFYHAYTAEVFEKDKLYSEKESEIVVSILQRMNEIWNSSVDDETKYQNMLICFNEIDKLLGENTVFGEKYRNQYFKKEYSLQNALEQYKSIMDEESFSNAYARYYADYMTVFAGLLPVVFGVFCLWRDQRYQMSEMIFSRRISSFQYLLLKYFGIILMFFLIYMLIAGISTGIFCYVSWNYGVSSDFFAFFKYTIYWVMPTVCITTASSMFLYLFCMNPVMALGMEVLVFFASAKDLCGKYYLWKPIIRFNKIGDYEFYKEHLEEIITNRILMIMFSIIFLFCCSVVFEQRRKGNSLFSKFNLFR